MANGTITGAFNCYGECAESSRLSSIKSDLFFCFRNHDTQLIDLLLLPVNNMIFISGRNRVDLGAVM